MFVEVRETATVKKILQEIKNTLFTIYVFLTAPRVAVNSC